MNSFIKKVILTPFYKLKCKNISKICFFLFSFSIFLLGSSFSNKLFSQIWVTRITYGMPVGTYYLGDKINTGSNWYFNFEIGQATWNSAQVGIGQNSDGTTGWNYADANWYEDGTAPNKRVRRDVAEFQFTATGTWYVTGRAKANSGDPYTYADETGWTNNTAFSTTNASYWTVSSLSAPSSQTATTASSSSINLSWTKWNSKNVMVVRSTSSSFTAPTQGASYSVGNTIGSGTVVYNSNGTAFTDTGLIPGTTYYYAFYSENYSYYSTNSSANATTKIDYRSKTNGDWNATGTWEKYDGSSWVNASATPVSTDGVITILNGHTVTVTASVTVDQVTIDAGGLVVLSAGTLTIANGADANDFIIRGTYRRSSTATTMSILASAVVQCDNGGTYAHNVAGGSLPTITWTDGSTLQIENSIQTGLDQSFWNVKVTGGTASAITYSDNVSHTMTVRNNFLLENGTFYVKNGGLTGGTHVLRVKGNFIQSGGSFSWNQSSSDNTSVIKLELEKDMIISGGTWGGYVSATDCNSAIYFLGTGEQTYSTILVHDSGGEMRNRFVYQTSSGPTGLNEVYNGSVKQYTIACTCVSVPTGFSKWPESGSLLKSMTVNNTNGVDMRHNRTINDSLYLKAGTLNYVSSTITMATGTTIDRSGGTLSAAPTFGSSVNVIYTQHSSQNITSYEIPSTATVLNNLTINSSNGVLLSSNIQVNGTCLVSAGTLSLSDKTLTMGNNGVITNNSSINSGTSTVVFAGIGSIGGSSETTFNNVTINGSDGNAGVDFGANKSLINGTLLINTWGYAHNNAPKYGSSSNLIYNTGNVYDRRVEWGATGIGTIGVTPGYPNNITVSSNTTLNYAHETVGIAKALFGDLTVDAGSSLFMDYGSPSPGISNSLTVNGDVLINGDLSLGNEIGGDIVVKGNWTRGAGSNFYPNERAVLFTGSSNQTINTNGGELFDYVILDNSNQLILQTNATIEEKLEMTSGDIVTGSNTLTIGTSTIEKGEISWTSGHVYGKIARWFNGTNSGIASGFMPLGFASNDRFVTIEYSVAPTTGGKLTLQWIDTEMGMNGLPISIPAVGTCNAFSLVYTCDQGYWQIDDSDGLSNDGDYDITLVGENINIITDICKLAAIKRVGGGNWQSSGTHVEPTGTNSRPVVKRSGATGWSNWGIGGGSENTLPVKLTDFSAVCFDQYIYTSWRCASEENNDFFTLQKSTDAKYWMDLAFIRGAGNSNTETNYSFNDKNIEIGKVNYYRLKQTDFDGGFSYSDIIRADCNFSANTIFSIYPNPNNGTFYITSEQDSSDEFSIKIFDATGKVIYLQNKIGQAHNEISVPNILSGFYFIVIESGNAKITKKLIIQN